MHDEHLPKTVCAIADPAFDEQLRGKANQYRF
jgi:hypothetical protein